jgi:membrane protein
VIAPKDHRGSAEGIGTSASEQAAGSKGRQASSPWAIPLAGWKDVALRTWRESSSDSIGLIAAGVAFYVFLALVPLLGAIVLSYGLFAEPSTVVSHMEGLTTLLPADIARLVGEQMVNVVQTSGEKKGLGALAALAIALFGARNAAGAIISALNIAYEEEERRGFIKVNLLALAITAVSVAVAAFALLAAGSLGVLHRLLPDSPVVVAATRVFSYAILAVVAAAAAATHYRYGPSRDQARWTWLTAGSALFAVCWVILTAGFGYYVANFGDYGATYGSLSAVVVLLTWTYFSSYALLFGAELNSELEHQTARDTTAGHQQPLGQRGAWAADHVAPSES